MAPGHTDEGKKIPINKVGVESLKKIWGIGEMRANLIVHFREATGNVTQESLELLIGKGLPEEELERIDFAPNGQTFTDKQQKRIGKDDMTPGHTDEDVWGICLKNDDFEGIWELLKGENLPPYDTFLMAVDKLSTHRENLKDFCRFVSNNLKGKIPDAKIVFPAINPENKSITFVVLSTNPCDQNSVDGYPVKMLNAYGECNEDYLIRNKQMGENLCFQTEDEEDKMNDAIRSAHDKFSKWPNFSRISYSFYKSTKFNENDKTLTLSKKDCIVLFVYLKHWEPVGWGFFPKNYCGYQIDVRMAMCARKHADTDQQVFKLPSEATSRGTIQGTLYSQGVKGKTFALTAAHTLLSDKKVKEYESRNKLVVIENNISKRFTPEQGEIRKIVLGGSPYVDAALVELAKPLQNKSFKFTWNTYGFRRKPSFRNCCRLGKPSVGDDVIKFGMQSGIRIGNVYSRDGIFDGQYGFLEIHPWNKPFSEPGDCGSFVFLVNKEIRVVTPQVGSRSNESDLALIGMVHAEHGRAYFATKMDETLKAFREEFIFEDWPDYPAANE